MVKDSRKNSKILYPIWILSQLKSTMAGQLCLDFCKKLCFDTKLAKKPKLSDFETIYGFCSYIRMDSNLTLKFSRIHDNFSLEPFLGQEVTGGTLSRGL